jgi:putative ABC transport system permease protein
MNVIQIVMKQMRQRALSTWLTLLSVLLGVGLAIAILILRREGGAIFGQTDYGYDVLVGPKGSPVQLVLNTAYHIDKSPGNIPYHYYESLVRSPMYRPMVKIAVPFAVGDTVRGQRVVATLPTLFGVGMDGEQLPADSVLEYRPGRRYTMAEGRAFHPRKFEAVVGSEIPGKLGLKVGDKFQVTHGMPAPEQTPDTHDEEWTVVGVLEPTRTANDRVLFIPLTSFYAIREHEDALGTMYQMTQGADPYAAKKTAAVPVPAVKKEEEHDHDHEEVTPATTKAAVHDDHEDHDHDHDQDHEGEHGPATTQAAHDHDHDEDHAPAATKSSEAAHDDHDDHDHEHGEKQYELTSGGEIELKLPKEAWQISAVLVKARGGGARAMQLMWMINNNPVAQGVNPATEMRKFFDIFLRPSGALLLLITVLVTVVAAVGILVSIYNSVSARLREIAILRALGATRVKVLSLICLEAGLIGLIGGLLGLVVGHLLAAGVSVGMERYLGEGFNWWKVDGVEWIYLGAVVVLATLAGLVPAMKAYRTSVAANLSAV